MVATRQELGDDYHVFFVTSQGYAADHWYGWFPKALNMHPEIFALLAHEGSRPKYFSERTRGERPDLLMFTEFLNDMGMTYQAIGDCYSYRGHMVPPLRQRFGDAIPIVNLVRHPYVWLEFYIRWRASNMRMRSGSTAPLEWEWKGCQHARFRDLGLHPYEKDEVPIWAAYQGMVMLEQFVLDYASGVPQIRLEDVAAQPELFQKLVSYLTKDRCNYPTNLLDQAYAFVNSPFRGEETLRMIPRELYEAWPDWKREAFRKLVSPQAKGLFQHWGYNLYGI